MTINLFEVATRYKFRFPSSKGYLSVEQLWQLPLSHHIIESLDEVAKGINAQLKREGEESFVKPTTNSIARHRLEQKLELVKHIITVKLDEADRAQKAKQRAGERHQLLSILAGKETQELQSMSKEDILKRLDELEE